MTPSPDPAQQVLQVATGYIASTALYAAITLNVADHLAAGPTGVAELALATGANEDALYRVLRLLASLGVFEEAGPRRFALTPAAAACGTCPARCAAWPCFCPIRSTSAFTPT